MWEAILSQLIGGVCILGVGVGIFFAVNTKRSVQVQGIDPATGERGMVTKWEYGTRRSRWQGYCVVVGTVLGFEVFGLWQLVSDAIRGTGVAFRSVAYCAPWGMMFGLLAGNVLGAFTSRFIPEQTRPPDPDAG